MSTVLHALDYAVFGLQGCFVLLWLLVLLYAAATCTAFITRLALSFIFD